MKFKEAMAGSDKKHWEKAVKEEFERMEEHKVFELVRLKMYLQAPKS